MAEPVDRTADNLDPVNFGALTGDEFMVIMQGTTLKKITFGQLVTFVQANIIGFTGSHTEGLGQVVTIVDGIVTNVAVP